MIWYASLGFVLLSLVVLAVQLWRMLGLRPGVGVGFALAALAGAVWLYTHGGLRSLEAEPPDFSHVAHVTSDSCFKCHENHHESWYRTFHRTMTRDAVPETVKGDFNDVRFHFQGVTSHMTRDGDVGDQFFMETADPAWAERVLQSKKPPEEWGRPGLKKFKVDRLVGSHWFQEYMHKDEAGRYIRLPLSFHIVENRWIHTNGAFLAPDTNDFWSKSTAWNESCVFCHNTKPSKNPSPPWGRGAGVRGLGYDTQVAELGIACEACHGPGEEHVRVNQSLARRWAVGRAGKGDPTIVNPERLSARLASEICGHCHGATVPRESAWDRKTVTDPFIPGEPLSRAFFVFWSEAEQLRLAKTQRQDPHPRQQPGPLDGRFWGDGTPLTTALEFQGMALSACYENGRGKLSCLSCHSMHDAQPHFQVKRGMETNDACYQCHPSYRGQLEQHTHHPANSSGSLCYNCHMPHQVYSLLTTHRTHRIHVPRVKDSVGTGKPHACNLCHLDKSLAWTQDRLKEWYGHERVELSGEDRNVASTLVHLMQSDARSRAVVAGMFSWPPALQASGKDWAGPVLIEAMKHDRYPAVRYLAQRGLRTIHGPEMNRYNYLGLPDEREAQLEVLIEKLTRSPTADPARYPHLPLRPAGSLDAAVILQLLKKRNDPDVVINE